VGYLGILRCGSGVAQCAKILVSGYSSTIDTSSDVSGSLVICMLNNMEVS
jgi:hypothetical protein